MPRNTTYIYVQPSIPDLTLKQIQTEIQLFNETQNSAAKISVWRSLTLSQLIKTLQREDPTIQQSEVFTEFVEKCLQQYIGRISTQNEVELITAAVLLLLDNNNAAEMHQNRINADTLQKLLDLTDSVIKQRDWFNQKNLMDAVMVAATRTNQTDLQITKDNYKLQLYSAKGNNSDIQIPSDYHGEDMFIESINYVDQKTQLGTNFPPNIVDVKMLRKTTRIS